MFFEGRFFNTGVIVPNHAHCRHCSINKPFNRINGLERLKDLFENTDNDLF